MDELVRRVRCSGCAFTPGTEAYESEITRTKAMLCVELGRRFYCHRNAQDNASIVLKKPEAICKGWLQTVTPLIENGSIMALSPDTRAMKELAMKCIGFAEGDSVKDDFTAEEWAILDRCAREQIDIGGEPNSFRSRIDCSKKRELR